MRQKRVVEKWCWPAVVLVLMLWFCNEGGALEPLDSTSFAALQEAGGVYTRNHTLLHQDGPYKVTKQIFIQAGASLTIEQGVKLYFASGIGVVVQGVLTAIGNKYVQIDFMPWRVPLEEMDNFPSYRLVDGPSTAKGRLQVLYEDRWRAVCSMMTNWTVADYSVACQSMGFSDGGFWKWYRRNNDTRPFVMPRPGCNSSHQELRQCANWTAERIMLSENLCQGEDDIGLTCWGPPTFRGWEYRWKGIEFQYAPWQYVPLSAVSIKKESKSRLEHVNIWFAGYDRETQNATAALLVHGMPPFMNYLDIRYSAGDGIQVAFADGPVEVTNSTISYNRGHGLVVENTTDGRLFVNESRIEFNYGDGIRFRPRLGLSYRPVVDELAGRDSIIYYEPETPEMDICHQHVLSSKRRSFPRILSAHLSQLAGANGDDWPCYVQLDFGRRLPITYTVQFLEVASFHSARDAADRLFLYVCENAKGRELCKFPRYRIPIENGQLPASIDARNSVGSLWIGLKYENGQNATIHRNGSHLVMKIHASLDDTVQYGLNVSNSRVTDNYGCGIYAEGVRDRTVINNVTISGNQHTAGLHIFDGVGDVWINNSMILQNWGDGVNISFSGGSLVVNGTQLIGNRMRGFAFHHYYNAAFLPLKHEVIFKGRPASNNDYTPTYVNENWWGGILVGNFCIPTGNTAHYLQSQPRVSVGYVELIGNKYHPAFEYHSCRQPGQPITHVEFSGSVCRLSSGFCFRVQPAVNIRLDINDCRFVENDRPVLMIRNREHAELADLPATVSITRNHMKYNNGPFIVNIGLNQASDSQSMVFHMQNEIKENTVTNPFPYLNARTVPHAALIVSSSNVVLRRNCFYNPKAEFEIATDLNEHAEVIDARENNWGSGLPSSFMYKIFDQFKRYTLAKVHVDPYAAVCNSQNLKLTELRNFFRQFRHAQQPDVIGGTVYENTDLPKGVYTVVDDLHVSPGAILTLQPGSVFNFKDSVGMLVQGELVRTDYNRSSEPILFTLAEREKALPWNIRIVADEQPLEEDTYAVSGRLEVLIDGEWGTVCNRSWTVEHASMACNQMGMVLDPEFLDNWRRYPLPGTLPIRLDNIRCEEMEYDITQCRHDGVGESVHLSCKPLEVVGIRCIEPRWAGIRYSLLANPASVTGQTTIKYLTVERAGLLDFRVPTFQAAFTIDWNYHLFEHLIVRDNFWTGVDVLYNDPVKKPKFVNCRFSNNRRYGVRLRSVGLTMENVTLAGNENAGLCYNPRISPAVQLSVSSWLRRSDANHQDGSIIFIPSDTIQEITLTSSSRESRKFLVASSSGCESRQTCVFEMVIRSLGISPGTDGKVGIQIVNRPSESGDENMVIYDEASGKKISLRDNLIEFPFLSVGSELRLTYARSRGPAVLSLLLFHMNSFEYVDDFLHMRSCNVLENQYGISAVHYSNFTHHDGSVLIRRRHSKMWFQKTNFTKNTHAVIWVSGPMVKLETDAPLAEVMYFIDNCSITLNNGSVIGNHRDLLSSANMFWWKVWQSTFSLNWNSGISVALPYPVNTWSNFSHKFELRESNFQDNEDFQFQLSGYHAWLNISSNNFTTNRAQHGFGLMKITGMEKEMIMERNRWQYNRGRWIVSYDIKSSSPTAWKIPSRVYYNYFLENYFLMPEDNYVDNWPRSYALGIFGVQNVDVHFNNFRNSLLDFEVVTGLKTYMFLSKANVSHNYWGRETKAGVLQRIFDFDDWNIYSLAEINPYFVTEERSINWEWRPEDAQLGTVDQEEPSIFDLHGRLYKSVTLKRQREKWTVFPYFYKPDKPYFIRKDLTIMPGAKLTIEKGVEVHIYPNVRILVLGSLEAHGTFWEPIRLKPINLTDVDMLRQVKSANRHGTSMLNVQRHHDEQGRFRKKRDVIYRIFPFLYRYDNFYFKFESFLTDGKDSSSGFLEIFNPLTGDRVPICDRQFTRRNAEVVCREIGLETKNVYVRIGARWQRDPKLYIVKRYSQPRQCFGYEKRLADCDLRLTNDDYTWKCTDAEHYVFIHCGRSRALNDDYVGHWGGLFFAADSVESADDSQSILRHVEIVGGGLSHNDSSAALTAVYRGVMLDHVNITNSSMHAMEVVAPRDEIMLHKVNMTHNLGVGLRVLALNMHSSSGIDDEPLKQVMFPYHLYGLVEFCSVDKLITVEKRVLVYYKYDSYPVDCYKVFTSSNKAKKLVFKLLLANIFNASNEAIRKDLLTLYDGTEMNPANILDSFGHEDSPQRLSQSTRSYQPSMTAHLRANAADGSYGILAEVVTVPAPPDPAPLKQLIIREGRFEHNDRGAVRYSCTGDINADVEIDMCSFDFNGYQLWENFTTSSGAVRLQLFNTQNLRLENSMFFRNPGGLFVTASSSTPSTRLLGIVKSCAFGNNFVWPSLNLIGRNYQKVYVVNNYFGRNWSPFMDTVFVDHVLVNFTRNTFYNNTGTHILHLGGYREVDTEFQVFSGNFLFENVATGHGYHFQPEYGYFGPYSSSPTDRRARKRRFAEQGKDGEPSSVYAAGRDGLTTSFEWWANVGMDAERYHSTIFVASGQQKFEGNFFNNPLNSFELTTAVVNDSDAYRGPIDARGNYWGQISTDAVASGKIRDGNDYDYLIKVDHTPVLESNTSLLDGSCPPGWFRAGYEDWKSFQSCFLFVPGAVSYGVAQQFCKDQGGYLPFFRDQDGRLLPLAEKVDRLNHQLTITDGRLIPYSPQYEVRFWISSVVVPPEKCGYLSSKTGSIGIYNCDDALPFVCEKGPKPYEEPLYWQSSGIAAIVVVCLLLLAVTILAFLWWLKSKRRKREFFERKSSLRASLRSLRNGAGQQQQPEKVIAAGYEGVGGGPRASSPDLIEAAHRNLVLGAKSIESLNDKRMVPSNASPSLIKFPVNGEVAYDSLDSSYLYQNGNAHRPRRHKASPRSSYCESAYRSCDLTPSSETSAQSSANSYVPIVKRRPNGVSEEKKAHMDSFSLFSDVPFTAWRGKPPRRRGNTSSELTVATGDTCSTCRTSTTTSFDPNCSVCLEEEEEKEYGGTEYTTTKTCSSCNTSSCTASSHEKNERSSGTTASQDSVSTSCSLETDDDVSGRRNNSHSVRNCTNAQPSRCGGRRVAYGVVGSRAPICLSDPLSRSSTELSDCTADPVYEMIGNGSKSTSCLQTTVLSSPTPLFSSFSRSSRYSGSGQPPEPLETAM